MSSRGDSVQFEQVEAVQGGLRVVGEGDEHVDVGHVEGGHQEVAGQAHKLVEGDLRRGI